MKRHPSITPTQFCPVVSVLLVSLLALATIGCTTVDITDQRLVSKPNMTFSETDVFDYSSGYHSTLEPGTAGSGGGQAGGCTSCQ